MFRIEIIDQEENIILLKEFNDKQDMIIKYNNIKNNISQRYKLHGYTMQLFEGQDEENLREIEKYRVEF